MFSLVYKDFLLQRGGKSFIYMGIMPIISTLALSTNILNVLMPYIAGSYLYIVYANALDDTFRTEKLFNAMPISRVRIVGSKYASVGIYLAAFLVIIAILGPAVRALVHEFSTMPLLSWSIIVQFLLVAGTYYSIYFPRYFKVGYQKSRWANYMALIASAGLYAALMKGVSEISGLDIVSIQEALAYISGISVNSWDLLLPVLTMVMIALSIKLSVIRYQRREF